MAESPLRDKSEKLADRIIKLYKYLCGEHKEFTISKQILRSGTSIGANVAEAGSASSVKDFISKLTIAAKECSETIYWLKRLKACGLITQKGFDSIYNDCSEIGKILTSSLKTSKKNLKDN